MDFLLSDDQSSVQQLARQILGDHTGMERLAQVAQQDKGFDEQLWQALAETGLLGLTIDEQYGGMGLGFYALSMLCEEVGRTVAPLPVIPVLAGAASTLQRFAGDKLRQRWLPGIAGGELLVTAALAEHLNEDPAQPRTTASEQADGWHLSGSKSCVAVADQAQRILLSARSDQGLMVLLLDPQAGGVQLNPQRVTSEETRFELVLDDAVVSADDVIATGNAAEEALRWAHQATRTALCATAVGLCDKMMRMTGSYTSEREQFGRAVATFQAVSHRVADCFIDVECLRLVTQQAASLVERGSDADEAVKVAKIWCGDVTHRVSQASQHCHGGAGVDRDYPLYRYCLWARQIELSAGSSAQLTGELGADIARQYLAGAA